MPRRGERGDRRPTWPRFAVVAAVFVAAFFVARGCQDEQVRITEQQAVSAAEEQADFEPDATQIRLLRQGLNSEPFWFVVLTQSSPRNEDRITKLAQFRINANTGGVQEVAQQDARKLRRQTRQQD
jgi:hypothetical protein